MENQEQNQGSVAPEQSDKDRGSSGMDKQQPENESGRTDTNQNDIAGNAEGNEQNEQPERDWSSSGIGGSDTRGEDSEEQNESAPLDGPVRPEEDEEDLRDIETEEDDELSAPG